MQLQPIFNRNRLRFLQALCQPMTAAGAAGGATSDDGDQRPHVILVIPGEDGMYNPGSQALLKYLLLNGGGRDMLEPTVDFQHAAMEDCVIAITATGATLYVGGGAWGALRNVTSSWRNLQVWSVSASDVAELPPAEAREEFKVRSFISLVHSKARVGLPLTPGYSRRKKVAPAAPKDPNAPAAFDQFEAESWPLVQAFGLDMFSMGGFFTMVHRVVPVTPALTSIFGHVDAAVLQRLLTSAVPTLVRHWDDSVSSLSISRTVHRRRGLVEQVVADPVVTHYDFSRMSIERTGDSVVPGGGARVLFGTHTAELTDDSSEHTLGTAGLGNTPALHMIVEAEDPTNSIRVSRSFFFRSLNVTPVHRPADVAVTEVDAGAVDAAGSDVAPATPTATAVVSEEALSAEPGTRDAQFLMQLYDILLQAQAACEETLKTCAPADAPRSCLFCVFGYFAPVEEDDGTYSSLLPEDFPLAERLVVDVRLFSADGRPIAASAADIRRNRVLVYVKISLTGIPSIEVPDAVLGSLTVGDTFAWHHPAAAPTGFLMNLTAPAISSTGQWVVGGVEEASVMNIERALGSQLMRSDALGLGTSLSPPIHNAQCLAGGVAIGAVSCSLRTCDQGLVLIHDGLGSVPLSLRRHVQDMEIIPADVASAQSGIQVPGSSELAALSSAWVSDVPSADSYVPEDVLVLYLTAEAPRFSKSPLLQQGECLGILLPHDSLLRKTALDALPGWTSVLRARDTGDEEAEAQPTPRRVTARVGTQLPTSGLVRGYAGHASRKWTTSLQHIQALEDAAVQDAFLLVPELPEAAEPPAADSVPVFIVAGAAGSGKTRLATALANHTGADYSWAIVQQPLKAGISFDLKRTQREVAAAAASLRKKGSRKPARILLVGPGFADVVALANCVMSAGPSVHIGGCITVINAGNVYRDARRIQLLPNLLEQCAAGWVSSIVLAASETVPRTELDEIKALVRAANSTASLTVLNGGLGRPVSLTAELASELLACPPFTAPQLARLRNLTCPGWHANSEFVPENLTIADQAAYDAQSRDVSWREKLASVQGVQPLADNVDAIVVQQPVCLDRERTIAFLSAALRRSPLPADAALAADVNGATAGLAGVECWRVKGVVHLTEDPSKAMQVDGVPGQLKLIPLEEHQHELGGSTLLFVGAGLKPAALEALMERCRPRPLPTLPLREATSLSEEEVEAVRTANLTAPLPPDVWFDGRRYMDHTGQPSKDHPDLAQFISAYLAAANTIIADHNAIAARQQAAADAEAAGDAASHGAWWEVSAAESGAVLRAVVPSLAQEVEDLLAGRAATRSLPYVVRVTPPTPTIVEVERPTPRRVEEGVSESKGDDTLGSDDDTQP